VKIYDDFSIEEILKYIDWTPFFRTWELAGKYPDILTDNIVGEQAANLFLDAKNMLKKIIDEKWLKAKGVVGIWRANSTGDDIELYSDKNGKKLLNKFHTLRQQNKKVQLQPNLALADFIAPKESGILLLLKNPA